MSNILSDINKLRIRVEALLTDIELSGAMLMLHEDEDGLVRGFTISSISGGADYVSQSGVEFPRKMSLMKIGDDKNEIMNYVAVPMEDHEKVVCEDQS